MIYNFQLHRITVILIVALLGVGGGLLFFSGLLVGVSWQLEKPAATASVASASTDSRAIDGPDAPRAAVNLPAGFGAAPAMTGPSVTAPTVTAPTVTAPSLTAPAAPTVAPPTYTTPRYTPPAVGVPISAGPAAMPAPLSPEAVTIPGAAPAAEEPAPAARAAAPAPRPAHPLRGLKAETPQEGFALQVGAFSQSENTQKLIAELAARGFEPYVVRTATRTSQQIESVRIGHFDSRADAIAASSELARAEGIRAFVVRASGIVQ